MKRDGLFFGENAELALVYIARKLAEALRLEAVLTEAGIDYLVEPDRYRGGVIFQSERVGAFFYVRAKEREGAEGVLKFHGFRPHEEEEEG